MQQDWQEDIEIGEQMKIKAKIKDQHSFKLNMK